MFDNIVKNLILEDNEPQNNFDLINHESVVRILDRVRKILFPGYFEIINKSLSLYLSDKTNDLYEDLKEQIKCASIMSKVELDSENITKVFIESLPGIKKLLNTDIDAIFNGDPAATNKDEIIFCYPGLYAITVYRIAHILYELKVPFIPRIFSEYAHSLTGIDIHPGATIGAYFFIDHGTGIVIGETSKIGEHVKIYQGVTLGALSLKEGQNLRGTSRHPTIEDYVTIYSGASIFGGKTIIGKNATIGSSTFITSSVPADTVVTLKSQQKKQN